MDTLPVTEARMQAEIEALRAQYGVISISVRKVGLAAEG